MLSGIFPRLLGLTLATVLPFTALLGGLLWDQWRQDHLAAQRSVLGATQAIAAQVDAQFNRFETLLAGLSQGLTIDTADIAQNDARLRRLKAELPAIVSNIFLYSPVGDNIGTSQEGSVQRLPAHERSHVRQAVTAARMTVGDLVMGRLTNRWIIGLARPVFDESRGVKGVLLISIHMTVFQEALELHDLPAGSVVRVVNQDGIIVARSLDADSWIGRKATSDIYPAAGQAPDEVNPTAQWADGVTRITGTARTTLAPWTVSVGFPSDIAAEHVRSRLFWGLTISALVLLTALTLAWFLAARMARPIRQLTADARLLAAGDLAHRTRVAASGEVGVLASTFNAMAAAQEARHQELDSIRKAATIEAAERKRLQEVERQSKEVLAAVIDTSPVGIVCTDLERRTTLWSRSAERIYGYTAHETLGERIKVVPLDRIEESASLFRQALQGETVRHVDVKRLRKDGAIIDVELSASMLHDPDGSVRGIAWAHHDVTQRKEAERQLAQSQKMEAIGQLTGGIAHDLNNLLLVIIGNLDLLNEKVAADPDNESLINASLAAAISGAELANGLLGFSRKQALQPEQIDTNTLVLDQIGFLKRALGPTIVVVTDLAEDTFPVHADPTQLKCALMNLIVNARDAMPSSGTLTVKTYNGALNGTADGTGISLAAGDYTVIEVSDTGVGISPENMQRIFEPFFTTKDVGKGTGLGLSMVFGFFQQSKGKVVVTSEVGRGTTFRAYLPRAQAQAAPQRQPAAKRPDTRGRERILVVDDEDMVRTIVVKHLASLGYDTIQAGSALEALDIVAQGEPFDLLFSDMVMPGNMSGLDLAAALREKRPDLKVLLTSGYPDLKERHDSFMDFALLKKPYRRTDLQNALRRLLDNAQIAA
jgi:PAS domain S-box-containing protein